jgi:UDP-2-acetamido-3-amino-2,3-dideoxy-glucuronate N-acetyltransferase
MSETPLAPARIHPKADVDPTAVVGRGSVVWANAGILAGVVIGRDVSIGRGCEIGRGSVIGDGSRIGWNTFLPPNSVVGTHVFLGPNVVCTDDRHPKVNRPWDKPYDARPPVIKDGAAVGAGVLLMPGVVIGVGARVAAGSIVTKDVPNYTAVRGGPARFFDPPKEWDALQSVVHP